MEQETDEALAGRVRSGDRDAFRVLVDRHKGSVFGLIRCKVDNRETAEDLAQEVFLKLYRSLPGFRGDAKLSTWLYRIAVNTVRDYVRAKRRRPLTAVLDVIKDWLGDPSQQPEEQVLAREEQDTVTGLLRRLPEKYREALYLQHYRQLSVHEIAQLLELPARTVETRLYRGKSLLKQQWLEVHGNGHPTSGRPEAGAVFKP